MRLNDFWAGTFGDEYLARNRVDIEKRVPFWQSAVDFCTPATVLEIGCNAGWNISAIESIDNSIEVVGYDINASAVEEARSQGLQVERGDFFTALSKHPSGSFDLVFTAGVLIHLHPDDLRAAMNALITLSGRYVLAIEYEAEKEEAIDYRGHAGKLWKRPFGKLYEEMGLKLLALGNAEGFDDCTYWLLEKGA